MSITVLQDYISHHLDVERPWYLYRFVDAAGAVLYVGSTKDPEGRLRQHRDKVWMPQATVYEWRAYSSKRRALDAERWYIDYCRPKYNTLVRPPRGPLPAPAGPVMSRLLEAA